MSSYRPKYEDFPPPPPPPDMPPLPPAPPPPPYNPHRDADRWPPRSLEHSARQGFSFRNRDSVPQYPGEQNSYRPAPHTGMHRRYHRDDNRNLNRTRRGNYSRGGRGPKYATSDRPLLRQEHGGDENFEMLGVSDGAVKYMNPEDVSDSSDEEMDVSYSDKEEGDIAHVGLDGNSDGEAAEPPTKRAAVGVVDQQGPAEPKWSNPDPYHVLPPVDETLARRRKDPVKQIRKSRKMAEEKAEGNVLAEKGIELKAAEINQVAANDDFISFDVDGGEDIIERELSVSGEDSGDDGGVVAPGTPTDHRQIRTPPNGHYNPSPEKDAQNGHYCSPSAHYSFSAPDPRSPRGATYEMSIQQAPLPIPNQVVLDTPNGVNSNQSRGDFADVAVDWDTSLGSRKRTHDDEIKESLRPLGKKGKGGTPNGSLLEEWIPDRGTNPTPWLRRSEYITAHPGFRLHKEICDFYDFVRPQRYEQVVREELLSRLQTLVNREMPKCSVHSFGSFAAGLYLPNADMDIVVMSESYRTRGEKVVCQTSTKMRKFGNFVSRSGLALPGTVEVIVGAKVPLVKFTDRITSIRIDVSFENDTGIIANKTFDEWKQHFPAMPVLVTVIKQFLMMRGLNEVMSGGIGGFSVTCLVTSLLQNMPRIQTGEMIPEEHLGELLIEFLDFYGNRLDISRTGIMMNPPGYIDKASFLEMHAYVRTSFRGPVYQALKADRIAIMDPNDPDHDISAGSRNVLAIFSRLSKAHAEILAAMKSPNRLSLLDWMLGGDYETFKWQRKHLQNLYNERYVGKSEFQIRLLQENDTPASKHQQSILPYETREIPDGGGKKDTQASKENVQERSTPRMTNAQRADRLRRKHPGIQDIPAEVSKLQHKELAPRYNAIRKSNRRATSSSSTLVLDSITNEQITSPTPIIKANPTAEAPAHSKRSGIQQQSRLKSQRSRSDHLKNQYPEAASLIPDLLDRQSFKKLVADLTKDVSNRGAPSKGQPPSRSSAPAPFSTLDPTQGRYGFVPPTSAPKPSLDRMALSGVARRAEVFRNLAGISRSEAIAMD
ncbi:MAG: hypothetical protein Q9217_002356 [Psora testacea]